MAYAYRFPTYRVVASFRGSSCSSDGFSGSAASRSSWGVLNLRFLF